MVDPLSPIYSELWRLQIHEFATVVTQNIPDLQGRPWRSKLLRMPFLVRLVSLTILWLIWWNFFFSNYFQIMENFNKSTIIFFLNIYRVTTYTNHQKAWEISFLMVYLVASYKLFPGSAFFYQAKFET